MYACCTHASRSQGTLAGQSCICRLDEASSQLEWQNSHKNRAAPARRAWHGVPLCTAQRACVSLRERARFSSGSTAASLQPMRSAHGARRARRAACATRLRQAGARREVRLRLRSWLLAVLLCRLSDALARAPWAAEDQPTDQQQGWGLFVAAGDTELQQPPSWRAR